ncbi:MAG TPA: SAM-dependent methyltransferase [Pseudonocardiaceae bacterium]|nr:SAM-dependent methyltransferase [Pseudonocardiaceae bacterium]
MEQLPDWVPDGIEVTVPNAARAYDYLLGGYHNFAVDREFVDRMETIAPGAIAHGHANRAFVGRSVRWLVHAGIRQFLDIGSGIPTLGNVHEVAQAAAPESKVIYVDIDPVAVAHSTAILAGNPRTAAIQGDVRYPKEILRHPDVHELLDFSRPIAVLLNAVLHFVPDSADLAGILAEFGGALVSGSYFTMTHGVQVKEWVDDAADVQRLYQRAPSAAHSRTREQILDLFAGLDVVEPGLVPANDWHPDPETSGDTPLGGLLAIVGRKP